MLARAGPGRAFAKGKAFIHSYSLIHSEVLAMRSEAQLPSPWLLLALHPASLPALQGCLGLLPQEERRGRQPGQHPFQLATALPPTLPPHKLGKTRRKIIFLCSREKRKNMYTTPRPKRLTIIFKEGGEWSERVQTSLSPVLIGNVSTVYVTRSVRVICYRRADFSLAA